MKPKWKFHPNTETWELTVKTPDEDFTAIIDSCEDSWYATLELDGAYFISGKEFRSAETAKAAVLAKMVLVARKNAHSWKKIAEELTAAKYEAKNEAKTRR